MARVLLPGVTHTSPPPWGSPASPFRPPSAQRAWLTCSLCWRKDSDSGSLASPVRLAHHCVSTARPSRMEPRLDWRP